MTASMWPLLAGGLLIGLLLTQAEGPGWLGFAVTFIGLFCGSVSGRLAERERVRRERG